MNNGILTQRLVTRRRHFRYGHFLTSKTYPRLAQDLLLDTYAQNTIKLGVESVLDPLADAVPGSLFITSGYRNLALNSAIGGSPNSDHLLTCAADIVGRRRLAAFVFAKALELQLPYRQLILYERKRFVHISWNIPGKPYKHEFLVR